MTVHYPRAMFLKEITDIVHQEFKQNPGVHKSYEDKLCWVVLQLTGTVTSLSKALAYFEGLYADDEDTRLHTLNLVMELFHPVCT